MYYLKSKYVYYYLSDNIYLEEKFKIMVTVIESVNICPLSTQ